MPYTEDQLHTVERLIGALAREYPIIDVVAHHDISPGRKVDTTPLMDWPRMRGVLESDAVEQHQQVSAPEAVSVGTAKPKSASPQTTQQAPTTATRWPTWKIPLAFAAGAVIIWALVTGKINSEDAHRMFKQLVQ